jgi:hypothetical protein
MMFRTVTFKHLNYHDYRIEQIKDIGENLFWILLNIASL